MNVKYLELNDTKNGIWQSLLDAAKVILWGIYVALHTFKKERINSKNIEKIYNKNKSCSQWHRKQRYNK